MYKHAFRILAYVPRGPRWGTLDLLRGNSYLYVVDGLCFMENNIYNNTVKYIIQANTLIFYYFSFALAFQSKLKFGIQVSL